DAAFPDHPVQGRGGVDRRSADARLPARRRPAAGAQPELNLTRPRADPAAERSRDVASVVAASRPQTPGVSMSSRDVRLAPPALWALLLSALVMRLSACSTTPAPALRGSGALGVVIERADGNVKVIETSGRGVLATVGGLGDLSHASV